MILPRLILSSRVNQSWKFSGPDQIDNCIDKQHFLSYPYNVEYNYNSRGFRDQEWPDSIQELADAIWCIGDSFTVGIGSPVAHTWPARLAQSSGKRTINVSMDGASNAWMARTAQQIVKTISPKNMVIMWSYTHRRELDDQSLSDEDRRLLTDKSDLTPDWQNLLDCKNSIDTIADSVQFAIPNFCPDFVNLTEFWEKIAGVNWPTRPPESLSDLNALPQWILLELQDIHSCLNQFWYTLQLKNVIPVQQQDFARDGLHFDLITTDWVVEKALLDLKL